MSSRKAPGRCVFCKGTPLTKEHIWSDWLSKIIPGVESHTWSGFRQTRMPGDGTVHNEPHFQTRQGAQIQRKIRNVCLSCNTGWMSELVKRTQPFVEAMVLGRAANLSPHDQTDLAAWIALAVIMAEFTHERTAGIPACDREWVRNNKVPPDSWNIFIGRYAGTEWGQTAYRHTGGKFMRVSDKVLAASQNQTETAIQIWQASTYTLGELVVHAFSSTDPEFVQVFRENWLPPPMARIWPPSVPLGGTGAAELAWPPNHVLGDEAMDRLVSPFRSPPFLAPSADTLPENTEALLDALTVKGMAVVPGDRVIKPGTTPGPAMIGMFTVFNRMDKPVYDVRFKAYSLDGSGKRLDDSVCHPDCGVLPPNTAWLLSTSFGTFQQLNPIRTPSLHIDITFSHRKMGLPEKAKFFYLAEIGPWGGWRWVPQV